MHWERTRLRHQGNSWTDCYSWTDGRQEEFLKEPLEHNFKWCLTSFDGWRVIEASRSWGYIITWKGMILFKDDLGKRHSRSPQKRTMDMERWLQLGHHGPILGQKYSKGDFFTSQESHVHCGPNHLNCKMICIPNHLNCKNIRCYRRTGIFKHFLAQKYGWEHVMRLSLQVGGWVRTNCGAGEPRHRGKIVKAAESRSTVLILWWTLHRPGQEQ